MLSGGVAVQGGGEVGAEGVNAEPTWFIIPFGGARPPKLNHVSNSQPKHEVQYGLKVSARHHSSSKVSTVFCHFGAKFGRESRSVKSFTNLKAALRAPASFNSDNLPARPMKARE
jgi:hypothetical protein